MLRTIPGCDLILLSTDKELEEIDISILNAAMQSNRPIFIERRKIYFIEYVIYGETEGEKDGEMQWKYTKIRRSANSKIPLNLPFDKGILERTNPLFSKNYDFI